MSLAIAEPFAAPVYPSYALVVEYPMELSTIKARLDNRFYRRVTAVQYDVRYVYTNACKFNEPKSDIVRSASIITDLCMEMIRNRDANDATALYHQLVEEYKKTPRDAVASADGAGPSGTRACKSRNNNNNSASAPNTPNTRAKSRRNSKTATRIWKTTRQLRKSVVQLLPSQKYASYFHLFTLVQLVDFI